MTSNVYTLPELVDLALRSPGKGAVNFNVLRVVLLKIIKECNLQNTTTEWMTVDNIAKADEQQNYEILPDHPILRKIDLEKGRKMAAGEDKGKAETETRKKVSQAPSSEENVLLLEPEKSVDAVSIDTVAVWEPPDSNKSEKKKESRSDEFESFSEHEKLMMTSATHKMGKNLYQLWEVRKLLKRIEGVEEELTSMVYVVDDLKEFKEASKGKIKFDEEEGLRSGYTGPVISRREFDDTIEEIGVALCRVAKRSRDQKESFEAANQDISKEMCLKVSYEDMRRCKDEFNGKLKNLSAAVRNIQRLIKDVIYPAACGTTKCMACKRKAHLPLRLTVVDEKKIHAELESYEIDTSIQGVPEKTDIDLKFTKAALRKSKITGDVPIYEDKKSTEDMEQAEKHPEKPVYPDYLINIEHFDDISKIARNFAPLKKIPDVMRRSSVFIPIIRPKQAPVTISIGSEKNAVLKTRHKET